MLPSPGLPSFDYVRPCSATEVSRLLLESNGRARLLMGGTDLFVRMRDGVIAPQLVVDLKHLPGLRRIEFIPGRGLIVGAAVSMNALARHPAVVRHYPLLVQALNSVASYQLRTRATMGGNLCNASPAADTAPAALVLEANLILSGPLGERCLPAGEFFLGPGQSALEPGEFLSRVEIPEPPPGATGHYLKLGRNALGDLAIVGAAAFRFLDPLAPSGYCFRLALASVAPTPIRVPAAEKILSESGLTPEAIDAAGGAAMDTARPIDDIRASAAYRKAMVGALTRRALQRIQK